MAENQQTRVERNVARIKEFYERKGGTKWHEVCADPRFFNRVWNAMLGLPKSDMPPPIDRR